MDLQHSKPRLLRACFTEDPLAPRSRGQAAWRLPPIPAQIRWERAPERSLLSNALSCHFLAPILHKRSPDRSEIAEKGKVEIDFLQRMSRRMTGNKHLPWIKMFLAIPSPNDMQGRSFSSVISFDRGQRTDNFSVCFAEAYRCGWKDLRSTQKINILNYIHCLSKLNNCVTQGCFHIRPQFASQT
ncbi:uncharacterized protein isoform X2 [Castor canadensis]|uniref:Uncharacterized protein isoform X2 n=1 Tax=Castor canadensis TaxID=51338 RepID=A0AC58KEI0_CASCN